MSSYYFDTSALVKVYVDETGSGWVRSLIRATPQPLLLVSHLVSAEVISALTRRLREGSLTAEDFHHTKIAFQNDCRGVFRIIVTTRSVVNLACDLLERHPLRAYDAVHLATALAANRSLVSRGHAALTFLSADSRPNDAASAEGLAVDNPNLHS